MVRHDRLDEARKQESLTDFMPLSTRDEKILKLFNVEPLEKDWKYAWSMPGMPDMKCKKWLWRLARIFTDYYELRHAFPRNGRDARIKRVVSEATRRDLEATVLVVWESAASNYADRVDLLCGILEELKVRVA